jgi:hypothetical protein
MFSTQLIFGVIVNVLTSLAPRIPDKNSLPLERHTKEYYLVGCIIMFYYLSFFIIIFSPGNKFINIGVCFALHFLINPLIAIAKKSE